MDWTCVKKCKLITKSHRRIHGKSTRGRKRIGMLSDLIGKKITHTSKEEYKIRISGEIGRWKIRMRVKNLQITQEEDIYIYLYTYIYI